MLLTPQERVWRPCSAAPRKDKHVNTRTHTHARRLPATPSYLAPPN